MNLPLFCFSAFYFVCCLSFQAVAKQEQELFNSYFDSAKFYLYKDPAQGLRWAQATDSLANTTDIALLKGRATNLLGITYLENGKYDSAITFFLKAGEIFEQTGNSDRYSETINNIGVIYMGLNLQEKARQYFTRAAALSGKEADSSNQAIALQNLGASFLESNFPDSAYRILEQALHIKLRMDRLESALITVANMSNCLRMLDQEQQALNFINTYVEDERFRPFHNTLTFAKLEMMHGRVLISLGRYDEAGVVLAGAERVARDIHKSDILVIIYRIFAEMEEVRGFFERSLSYQAKADSLEDMLNMPGQLSTVVSEHMNYAHAQEIEKKEVQLKKLDADLNFYIFLATGLIFLVLIIFFATRYLLKKKAEALTSKNAEIASKEVELVRRSNTLGELKLVAEKLGREKTATDPGEVSKLAGELRRKLGSAGLQDQAWQDFTETFNLLHPEFEKTLRKKHPDLVAAEIRLSALLRLGMNSQQIADLQGVAIKTVKNNRSRIRNKMQLKRSENLVEYLQKVGL